MSEYAVILSFWLRACDSSVVCASTDAEAYHLATAAAGQMMRSTSHPGEIDLDSRRDGLISYVARLDDGPCDLMEAIAFDGDCPLHPEARDLVTRIARLDGNIGSVEALSLLRNLICEARAVPTNRLDLPVEPPASSRPWSVDQVYEYRGDPQDYRVSVVDDVGIALVLNPRLDLRNHSPTGFAWGYNGSGPAQLALAILCHALNSDQRAEELYQEFKDEFVVRLERDRAWQIRTPQIFDWILRHPSAVQAGHDGQNLSPTSPSR